MTEDEAYAAYEAAQAAYGPHSTAATARRFPSVEGYAGFTPEDQAEFTRIVAEIERTYQTYLDALPLRWYVVADYPDEADKEGSVWTLSHDPRKEGWCTDSGCWRYGLTFAEATELADAANAAWELKTGGKS